MNTDELKELAFNAVLDHGHGIVISPSTVGIEAPHAYTVGRQMKGRPELLITGVDTEAEAAILNEVALLDDYFPLQVDTCVSAGGVVVKIVETHPVNLIAAVLSFGRISALQVLLPDAAGEYPDTIRGRTPLQPYIPVIDPSRWDPYDEFEENE